MIESDIVEHKKQEDEHIEVESKEHRWGTGDQFNFSVPRDTEVKLTEFAVRFVLPCGCEIVVKADERTATWSCPHSRGYYRRVGKQ